MSDNRIIRVTGDSESRLAPAVADITNNVHSQGIIIVPSETQAKRLAVDLSFFVRKKVYVMPSDEDVFLRYEAKNHDLLFERIRALSALAGGEECVVVVPDSAADRKYPPHDIFIKNSISVSAGGYIDLEDIKRRLSNIGYERAQLVEARGEFSVRGGIVDIFTPDHENPHRIELFDDEVDSIREFDIDTQRSIQSLDNLKIIPAELVLNDDGAFARAIERIEKEYGDDAEKDRMIEFLSNGINVQYMENYIDYLYDKPERLWDYMVSGDVIIDGSKPAFNIPGRAIETRYIESKQTASFNGRMDILEAELKKYATGGFEVTIVCANADRRSNMTDFLERCGLSGRVNTAIGRLTAGVELPAEKRCYIWDGDIFKARKYGRTGKKGKLEGAQMIRSFSDMQNGDYVVHENHGIGKFLGVEQLTVQNVKRDYLKIKYADEDILYVPVDQMDIIQKYIGSDGAPPKINRLSGGEWRKVKSRAKAAIANMAKELLEISAKRKMTTGYAFSADTVWQSEFEDGFEYQETEDQLRCVKEIKADMEEDFKMDRLLCGDVGFGKTEVAARALFKCAVEGKQAAVLVPTTILANQHFYTLKDRFEPFPFNVEMLSRFKSDKEQGEIIKKLGNGGIDVIIGTHRLLSDDVGFKDLGLLVIDEEQRFGVRHKEKIKRLKESVDILMLSATPIPRTLHMSLSGIRDMSLIEEPPEERYPVQTYVLEQEDELIREAVARELARGGQAFVVFNRISGIYRIAGKIQQLVPDAKVAVGHGQMNERALEDVMLDFISGETNVLVSTTIIESGIDIPNVNTIIILDCDKFGLSQLYQLRGRVGRSNRMAYAYLMYRKNKALTDTAEKRLRAIKEFTEFGSGFKVAMKDLEIRGAGNLLGTQQHGHMMMIGYELYCKLVDDAVRALGGEIVNPDSEECSVELAASAYIPDDYISDEVLKLQMYKKIASVATGEDESEIVDELIDRFGDAPKETLDLIRISRIRSLAEKARITRIYEYEGKLIFNFAENNGLTAKMLSELSAKYGERIFIHVGSRLFIRLAYVKNAVKISDALAFLELIDVLC